MAEKCEKFLVSGMVQGVGFRYQTCYKGMELGLTGYARNLNNGNVEVVACGDSAAVDALAEWLKKGPRRTGMVDEVIREPSHYKPYKSFKIVY